MKAVEETNPHSILNEDNPFRAEKRSPEKHNSFASKTTAVDVSKNTNQLHNVRRSRRLIMDARNAQGLNFRGSQQQRGSQSTNPALFSDGDHSDH